MNGGGAGGAAPAVGPDGCWAPTSADATDNGTRLARSARAIPTSTARAVALLIRSPLPLAFAREPTAPAGARHAYCSGRRAPAKGGRLPARPHLHHLEDGAARRLAHLDADREHLLHFRDVRDDEHLLEVVLDRADRLHQPLQPLRILRAEPLVHDQGLEAGAGAAGRELGEGDAQREVDAEGLAAAEQLVAARAQLVGDLDLEGLDRVTFLRVALGLELQVHPVVGHAREERIRLALDLWNGALDDHRLDALLAEGDGQLTVDAALGEEPRPLRR